MILEAASIEDDTLDTFLAKALGDQLANRRGTFDIAAACDVLLQTARRDQGSAISVVDRLSVDVLRAAINSEARALRCSDDLFPDAKMNALSCLRCVFELS